MEAVVGWLRLVPASRQKPTLRGRLVQRRDLHRPAYQPVVKVEPRYERPFSAESSFENLADTRIACGFPALIRQKFPRSRWRLTFATGCYRRCPGCKLQ